MISRMQQLIKIVEKLYRLELYEDLCLFAEINLPIEPSKMFMDCDELDDQRGYILYCLANSYAQLNHFPQAIRNYEMAIRYIGNIKQRKLQNRYENMLNTAELRFQMHKLYLQNKQEEEALHCLECVPRADLTPKVLLAMAHLCHQLAKMPSQSQSNRALFNKRVEIPNNRIVNYYKAIIKDVPEAIFCQSYLISVGAIKTTPKTLTIDQQHNNENGNLFATSETYLWNEVKQLQAQKCYLEAAKLLDNPPNGNNLRFLLEQGRFYRMTGDHQKALACYQQAHLLDPTNAEGMDAFAALLATHTNSQQIQRELDSLAGKMLNSNPRRPESFVIYGWAQRQCHRAVEAKQFAQRGEQLALRRGYQRSECCLLKAQILFDSKRHYKEMELVLADALHNDCTNTAVYALYIQMFIAQKRYAEAQRMAKASMKFVGEQNHQIRFLMAQALADDPSGGGHSGTENAIVILEKMVQEGHLSLDPLLLLSRLYDRQQKYEKAITLLNRFKESYGDPRIHRELGDLLSKTNRPGEALGEYGQAMDGSSKTDSSTKIINLMGGFTTPQCAVNAAFENNAGGIGGGGSSGAGPADSRGIRIMPPPVARVTRRTAINQHEQLRRLRGMGTMSATGSMGSNSGGNGTRITTQMRRLTTTRGAGPSSSGSSEMLVASGLSPVLAPLHFDDDPQEGNGTSEIAESSDEGSDSSQLSLDEEEGANNAERDNNHSSSSTALEQSRANNGQGNGDQTAIRHMVRDIQRYLAASRSSATPPSVTATSSSTTTMSMGQRGGQRQQRQSTDGRAAITTTTTVQQRPASFAPIASSFDDDVDFVPLIADEPLLERDVTEDESRMSIDNSAGDLLVLSEDDEEMNN